MLEPNPASPSALHIIRTRSPLYVVLKMLVDLGVQPVLVGGEVQYEALVVVRTQERRAHEEVC